MDSPPLTRRGPPDEDVPKDAQPTVPSLGLAAAFGRVGLDGGGNNNDDGDEATRAVGAESSDVTSSSAVSSSELDSDWSSSAGEEGDGEVEGVVVAPTPSARRGRPQGMPALGLGGLALGGAGGSRDTEPPSVAEETQPVVNAPSRQTVQVSQPDSPGTPMSQGVTPNTADPSSSQGFGPRLKLTLALPRSPVDRAPGGARGGDDIPESQQMNANVVKVDLLSAGFHLELSTAGETGGSEAPNIDSKALDAIRTRCVNSFGISPDDLCFYEMRPLLSDGASQPDKQPGARHIAVAIKHSTFSLGALEDLLAENKRLSAASERSSGALESLENMMRDQTHTFTRTQLRASELEADARRLKDRVRNLEVEAETLRDQLKRSDQLRLQGQKALDELKHEFESLTQDIAASGISPNYPKRNQSPRNNNQSMRSPRLRPPSAPASSAGFQQLLVPDSRVTHVLDRLCSDEVLTRLEKFLGSMSIHEQQPHL
eukprot:CAMPEP_0177756124 /NCGR_PEP_ID=MMETSP0491_2-20121128/2941_1 /TAXON_ID=63592 /ORGANISM="Tetraselmis chuii, Strain PLY429" /LENGTH=485 /DNA_ID=CAMNT_0019271685 /DNA_START=180 /DNA_END=1637 /DNA_ORIENTATION=-